MDVNSREPSQNIIPFRIKGVEIARFDSSGNLKIGTTTTLAPTVRLDISGGEARVNSGSVTSTALTTTGRIGVNVASPTVSLDVSGAVQITTSSIVATALTTRGRIGINTTSPPTSDLDVNGTVIMRSTLLLNNSLTLPTVFWHKSSDNVERLQYISNGNTIFKSGSGFLWYDSNNAPRMWLSNSGLLGIGTTEPTVALDVSGASRMAALSATSTALTTVGRIGVNNAAPAVDLDVNGEGNISTGLSIGSTTNNSSVGGLSAKLVIYHASDARIYLTHGSNEGMLISNNSTNSLIAHRGTGGEFVLNCEQNRPMKFRTTNTDRMTIMGDGKVGIGTTSPTVPLEVVGNTIFRNALRIGSTTAPTVALDVTGAANISSNLDVTGTSRFRAKTIQQVDLWQETSDGLERIHYGNAGTTYFKSGNGYVWKKADNSDIMTLTTSGRLGIGTSSPNTALDVDTGRIRATGIKLGKDSTTTDDMTENSSLDINNSTIARSRFTCGSNRITIGMSTVESFIWNETDTRMVFGTNAAYRMVISAAGFVGIGTTSPEYLLHVKGTSSSSVSKQTYGGYIGDEGAGYASLAYRNVIANFDGGWVTSTNTAGFIILSDQRIKSDIITLDTTIGLELYRKLRVVKHGYIDKLSFGNITKYGFIAQEIQKILPDAVITKTDIIPSIYKSATIINNTLLHFDNPITDIQQFNIGTKLKCYDAKNEIVWATIKCVIDAQNIEIEEEITNDKLFVFGHSVDDLLQIDFDPIRNLTTAALQEVDRQQQADKARIAELEATVATQQSLINDILERLNKSGL